MIHRTFRCNWAIRTIIMEFNKNETIFCINFSFISMQWLITLLIDNKTIWTRQRHSNSFPFLFPITFKFGHLKSLPKINQQSAGSAQQQRFRATSNRLIQAQKINWLSSTQGFFFFVSAHKLEEQKPIIIKKIYSNTK